VFPSSSENMAEEHSRNSFQITLGTVERSTPTQQTFLQL